MRYFPTWLWRLRSPMTCYLPAGGPGQPGVEFWSKPKGPEDQGIQWSQSERSRSTDAQGQRRRMTQLKRRAGLPALRLFAPLGPQWVRWGRSSWVRAVLLWIEKLIPSRNLTEASRNNVSPATWATLSPIKLMHQINHHNVCCEND